MMVYASNSEKAPPVPQTQSLLPNLFPIILIMFIFYFLLIRPQMKQQQKHKEMLSRLRKGDKVVTSGGIYGVIVGLNEKDDIVVLKIAENVKIGVSRSNITRVIGVEEVKS